MGGGTSSTEIAREIGAFAKHVYQSGRGTAFDLPLEFLPSKCQRVAEINRFSTSGDGSSNASRLNPSQPIPGRVALKDGTVLTQIDRVIVCTGYHYNYPFLRDLHAQDPVHTAPDSAESVATSKDSRLLVTDGTCTLNLHKDMFYIPDPTLTFAGISLFISTFSFFEYQTMVIAAALSGRASLPSREEMESHYAERLKTRGPTKMMNARMDEEVSYVDALVAWLNESDPSQRVEGFSESWHAVRDMGKLEKIRARFAREEAERKLGQAAAIAADTSSRVK